MQIQITGRHLDITDAIRDFINTKFQRVERYFEHITQIKVILSLENKMHRAEALVFIAGGEIVAHADAENMYAAIDSLIDKIDRQLIKHKQKLTQHSGEKIYDDLKDVDED